VQDTTDRAIERSLDARRRMAGDHIFDNGRGRPLGYPLAEYTFKRLIRVAGLEVANPDHPRPHIHSLRHTFAVRALEACPPDRAKVDRHVLALSTYLGHAHLSCTYWYLQATPQLMKSIAQRAEASFCGDCP
jgi:integrase